MEDPKDNNNEDPKDKEEEKVNEDQKIKNHI